MIACTTMNDCSRTLLQDYVVRLSDEALLYELAESVQHYYHRIADGRAAATVALMQVLYCTV